MSYVFILWEASTMSDEQNPILRRLRERAQNSPPPPPPTNEPSAPTPSEPAAKRDYTAEWRARGMPITYGLTHQGDIDDWARSAYHSGLAAVERGAYAEARAAFKRALDSEKDFIDAHLWLARLAEDAESKRDHYGTILALMGNHAEAMRELMVLNGQLSRTEADHLASTPYQPESQRASAPVPASAERLACPNCGGDLTGQAQHDGRITCRFCGFIVEIAPDAEGYGMKHLGMTMLKRRGSGAVLWEVGARLLRCSACGAERQLSANALARRCPFCNSQQVIETDALQSFEQPDGILPFTLDEGQARSALEQALKSPMERFKGLFANNSVKDLRITGVYLPAWVFDVNLNVQRTIRDTRNITSDSRYRLQNIEQREMLSEMASDVPIWGVQSPPATLLARLPAYDWERVRPYAPQALAGYEAELYQQDVEAASLEARQWVSRLMREKYTPLQTDRDYQVSVVSFIQSMQYRLLLCAVWVANLLEADGDQRLALIHGQTGAVVLGSARKPTTS